MLGNHVCHQHIASCGSGCDHKRACLDLIRNDGVHCAVETLYPTDLDDIRTGTHDIGAHGVQKVRQVYDMRFFRRIFDHGQTLGTNCRQHGVHGRTHGNNV